MRGREEKKESPKGRKVSLSLISRNRKKERKKEKKNLFTQKKIGDHITKREIFYSTKTLSFDAFETFYKIEKQREKKRETK